MNKSSTFLGGMLLALTALAMPIVNAAEEAILYKNPSCTCCDKYADYLREGGFKVSIVADSAQLQQINKAAGLPYSLAGCHAVAIDGYVVSGHVPLTAVNKLLAEHPAIRGITLAGMPPGSPGMDGTQQKPFEIYAFDGDKSWLYMTQ
ncbi:MULTISPECIES: DUF411 domain-containing protein [unclassified Pseudomonas]|uniref:DUF411 domain-containing protein n=1 Tax=unclassified Pseudomonas TaxID=196821 RepID=UPI000645AE5D|nr:MULTISPECIES: DUF411 domain-containing protein [unclassified Pseudomonas]